jgi:hypothetical protein
MSYMMILVLTNWLNTSSLADYNGDGVCNGQDYAIVLSENEHSKIILWGRTDAILRENSVAYVEDLKEKRKRLAGYNAINMDVLLKEWERTLAE